jgi:hypothetical protein
VWGGGIAGRRRGVGTPRFLLELVILGMREDGGGDLYHKKQVVSQ